MLWKYYILGVCETEREREGGESARMKATIIG